MIITKNWGLKTFGIYFVLYHNFFTISLLPNYNHLRHLRLPRHHYHINPWALISWNLLSVFWQLHWFFLVVQYCAFCSLFQPLFSFWSYTVCNHLSLVYRYIFLTFPFLFLFSLNPFLLMFCWFVILEAKVRYLFSATISSVSVSTKSSSQKASLLNGHISGVEHLVLGRAWIWKCRLCHFSNLIKR